MEYRFDFDDQLPDLPTAFDLDEVADLFQRKLLGQESPLGTEGRINVNKLQDLKYRPSNRCVTTYEMVVNRGENSPDPTIGVLEFTPEGVRPRIFTADDRLPWLTLATDINEMQKRFSALPGVGENIKLLEISPIRYKPGLHCVIRYIAETDTGKAVFYGKTFSGGAEQLMETIRALHLASQENLEMPLIPAPITLWPDIQMILQSAVNGFEFTTFAYDPAVDASVRENWMRRVGYALGVFHNNSTVPGETKTIYDDLTDLHEYTLVMSKVRPDLATKYEEVIQQIITKADHFREPKAVASHGAMRTDQFILQGERLAIIDLDGYCWANPARDLGNFLAYLCWKAIRQPEHAQFVERAGRTFLEGYLSEQPEIDERWLSVYQATSLLKIAGRRFRSLTFLEWPLVIHLIHAAFAAINEDLSDLDAGSIGDHRGTLVAHLRTASAKTKFPHTFTDKEFPALWSALNVEIMNSDLSPILNNVACSDTSSSRIVHRAKLLAYKPGKRGVIRYDLDEIACQKYFSVYGKLYPNSNLSERAYNVMKSLYDDVFCGVPDLGVPQPLGFIPELSMLVFIPGQGKFLGELIAKHPLDSPEVIRSMELTGKWLAQLHTHTIPLEKEFRVENEVNNIRDWAALICNKYPDESRAVNHIADYLVNKATELDFSLHVPIHKDFHYEHILIDGRIHVFDFDEMRLGDPNFDLAHFCANFYLLAYRNHKHTAQFTSLQNHFFESYSNGTGWRMDEKFLFFYIYSCLKITKQLCKLRGPRPWPEGEEQRAQVWLMLEQGLTALASAKARFSQAETGLSVYEFSKIRRSGWVKAGRISKSATSSEAIHASHRPLS